MRGSILENKENLVSVRLKLDPAQYHPDCDVTEIDEYVGYVLQEHEDGSYSVFVPDAGLEDPVMRMMIPGLEQSSHSGERYQYLKQMIIDQLPTKGVDSDKTSEEVNACDCIHELEDIMKFNNFADSEILELMKEYISETESN